MKDEERKIKKFISFYSTRAQPGAQADLRQKPRSPLSSTLAFLRNYYHAAKHQYQNPLC
jgi:hypothetical protein